MHEQRLNLRLLKYWEMLRKDQPMPIIQHFNSNQVEDVWPACLQITVERAQANGVSYKFSYMGPSIIQMFGQDLTGTSVDMRQRSFPGVVLTQKLNQVMEKGAPLLDDNHFSNAQGKLIKYRGCFLPFGSDKTGISTIIVGISHRTY